MKIDYANDPGCLNDLSIDQQAVLISWIRDVLVPARGVYRRMSYEMKHDFEREPEGFYVTNGMFKGAMLKAGYCPINADALYWRFRVKPAIDLNAWEKERRGRWSSRVLARDRWRERGYVVLQRRERGRILEHDRACRREARPKILALVGSSLAEITLDTDPAGYRLTREAEQELMRLFTKFDRYGRTWWIANENLAVVRRVPMEWAEEIATTLVRIANHCRPQFVRGESILGIS